MLNYHKIVVVKVPVYVNGWGLRCLTPLSTIFQLLNFIYTYLSYYNLSTHGIKIRSWFLCFIVQSHWCPLVGKKALKRHNYLFLTGGIRVWIATDRWECSLYVSIERTIYRSHSSIILVLCKTFIHNRIPTPHAYILYIVLFIYFFACTL